MGDLFCPATLIVASHAEATYDVLDVASDDGGWLTDLGRKQAAALAASLRDRRVAAIWCSDMARAVQTAEIVAAVLGVSVRVRAGLRETSAGETGEDVVRRVSAELESAADQFRGETMLVVSHGGSISLTVPFLATNVANDFARGRLPANCASCEITADADGWLLRSWAVGPEAGLEQAVDVVREPH